jgi:phosphoadenosine phosphosulfate reductase
MNLALQQRSTRLLPSLFSLDVVTAEAIGFLRAHEPSEGYFVGFSGGKDSIVTLELCRMAGVKHQAYYRGFE